LVYTEFLFIEAFPVVYTEFLFIEDFSYIVVVSFIGGELKSWSQKDLVYTGFTLIIKTSHNNTKEFLNSYLLRLSQWFIQNSYLLRLSQY
jgi:hypothetical protein